MTTTIDKLNNCTMVYTCVVPGCGSRSDRDHHLSFLSSKQEPSEEVAARDWMKKCTIKKNSRIP